MRADEIDYDQLLELMLAEFHISDNAWLATFCVPCDKDGLAAALYKKLSDCPPKESP